MTERTEHSKGVGPVGWLLFAALLIAGRLVRKADPEAQGRPVSESRDQREPTGRPPRRRVSQSAVLAALTIGAGLGGWAWLPPESSLPNPSGSIFASVDLADATSVTEVAFSIMPQEQDIWILTVEVDTSTLSQERIEVRVQDLELAPCDTVPPGEHGKLGPREWCEASQAFYTPPTTNADGEKRSSIIVADLLPSLNPKRPAPNSRVVAVFPIRASGTFLGFSESRSGLNVITPTVLVVRDRNTGTSDPVRTRFDITTNRGPDLEWGGLSPFGVDESEVAWAYDLDRNDPVPNFSRGTDTRIAATDQQAVFISGILFGLAVAAFVGTLQALLSRE